MTMCKRLLAATTAAFILFAGAAGAAQVVEIDRIVAVVDDDVITATELNDRVTSVRQQLAARGTEPPAAEALRDQVLERMVVERLQLNLAESQNIRVDDMTVNRVLENIAEENGLDLLQFKAALERDGVDYAAFREQIRDEIIITRLRDRHVKNRVNVLPSEVETFLETQGAALQQGAEYHIAHLLVAVPEAASPAQVRAARERAEGLLARLRAGERFEQLVLAHSDGPDALEGGDLGWRKADQLPTIFADVVPGLEPGAVSDLIRSPSGYHIVHLADKRGGARHLVEQTHARHILIKTDELTSDSEARMRLERLRERVLAGDDFAELAKAHSQDVGSGAKGGDLGWAGPGSFVPAFEETMNALEQGELSRPFRSQFGWHIVQVLDRRQHDDTAQYLRERAHAAVRERKEEEELQAWMRRLRDEAYVDVRLDS